MDRKEFPIPVRAIGPGSQIEEEELVYMSMPQGMDTYRQPVLPEPEEMGACAGAKRALQAICDGMAACLDDEVNRIVPLDSLGPADRELMNSVLGEGEVSARVENLPGGREARIQESVYAGVWRVLVMQGDAVVQDTVEIGSIPHLLEDVALLDARPDMPRWLGELPPMVQSAPMLLNEMEDQFLAWQPGHDAYVINLTLLPVNEADIGFIDHHLGTGRVLILSRGYGNCRITNACVPNTWRVVYYNSQDTVILNTVEIGALPEVARAAGEDLQDSLQRLSDVIAWVETGA